MYPRPAIPEGFAYCTKCKQIKPVAAFYRNKNTPTGLASWCKADLAAAQPLYAYRKRQAYRWRRLRHGSDLRGIPLGQPRGGILAALADERERWGA